jgi:hypothetical protein
LLGLGVGLVCLGWFACGAEAPPLSELELRDALRADPAIIARLGAAECQHLAERLEAAREQPEADPTTTASGAAPAHLLASLDDGRAAHGRDALALARLYRSDGSVGLLAVLVAPGDKPAPALWLLNPAQAEGDAVSAARERSALAGRAGRILAALSQQTGATTLVRVSGWPVGVVEQDGTLFVNAAWLVALGALDPPPTGTAAPEGAPEGAPGVSGRRGLTTRDYGFNPYNLPGSLDTCRQVVSDVCQCAAGGACAHTPLDATFANAQEECAWVSLNPAINARALCAYAMAKISSVQSCIVSSGACGALGTRDEAQKSVAVSACQAAIDACLADVTSGGNPPSTSSGKSCVQSCSEEFGRALGASCERSCEKSCNSCQASSCKGSSTGSQSCGSKSCTLAGGRADPSPGAAWGFLFLYLFSPIAYVLYQVGRRP